MGPPSKIFKPFSNGLQPTFLIASLFNFNFFRMFCNLGNLEYEGVEPDEGDEPDERDVLSKLLII
jgi:hypothetical protein